MASHVRQAIERKIAEVQSPLLAMLPDDYRARRDDGDLSLRKIAWALCSDAQEKGYDHGANPTMIGFDSPFPHCPRHLGIALSVRESLSRDLNDWDPRRSERRG